MPQYHDIDAFLTMRDAGLPLLDARAPLEFARGHIPGAVSLPVLNDEERAAVGTANAKGGPQAALHAALNLAGPQLAQRLAQARRAIQEQSRASSGGAEVLVHCWRGGLRSSALAWLLESAGFTAHVLSGGYKAYRAWVRAALARPARVLVLGGLTGSGKTEVLRALAGLGSQVIDLEGLAGHRGSAFGGVGLPVQPSGESMENALCEQWLRLDRSRPVWLEDEDRRLGDIALCAEFFQHLQGGRLVWLEVPRQRRVERLARLYAAPELQGELSAAVLRLEKRLGSEAARNCAEDIRAGRLAVAVSGILDYYDKLYARQLQKRAEPPAASLECVTSDPLEIARRLQKLERRAVWPVG